MSDRELQKNKGKEEKEVKNPADFSRSKKVENAPHFPPLRFPEFDGDWEEKRLGEMGEIKTSSVDKKIKDNECKIGLLNYMDVYKRNHIYHTDLFQQVTAPKSQIDSSNLLRGDILFTPSSETPDDIGHSAVVMEDLKDVLFSYHLIRFRMKKEFLIPSFSAYAFKSFNFYRGLQRKAQGATRYTLSKSAIEESKILFPQKPEQEKIASFLSSVDDWLENLKKQKEEWEKYKKGIMQQIFPAKNQKTPKLRFPEFDGNWEEKKLGDLLIEINDRTTENNQYVGLSSTKDGIFIQEEYFKKRIASKNNIGYKILKKDQLVFSPQNLWMGNINVNTKFDIGIVSPSYKIYDFNEQYTFAGYFKYMIKTKRMLYEYGLASEQGASIVRRNLNIELFNLIPIKLPSLPEQEKIALFLTSIDDIINSMEAKITALENWKKGLMQRMFV